jgi:anion-transporting  ArsA/GET3 family ATPase
MPQNPFQPLAFVTGKGGTGKSTVTAALGLASARAGRRTLVVETHNHTDILAILGASLGKVHEEKEIRDGLHHVSIDSDAVLSEYLSDQLPGPMAAVVRRSRAFSTLAAATPGLRELLTIGKIWEMAQPERRLPGGKPYDAVIVDAPATGHGIAMLASPHTFAQAARGGPVMSQATMINDSLKDPAQTTILAVTRPEELPINETIELATTVPETFPDQRLLRVLINRVLPKHFTASELERLQQAAPANRQIKAALAQAEHRAAQQRQIGRVRRALDSETALRSLPEVGRLADDELLALAKAAMR